MTDGLRQFLTPYTHAHTHSADSIDETINVNFPKQPVSVFPFNHLSSDQRHLSFRLLSRRLWVVVFSLSRPLAFLSHAVWLFLGSPGDTVPLSRLTDRHGQNESSSELPTARLCPRGGLAGRISMRPVGSVSTQCDRPWAPLAPHTLNRIIQPCLHRLARSMGWTAHANSCQGDTLVGWD